jgi:type I restriction enzyme M protein
MALKKSELYSSLWQSCDELRGGMDASQYKDYVLVLLFVKYVSDKYAGQKYAPISIPPGASFADMVALKGRSDIGDQINKKILGPLAKANNLSDMPDFNDANKLGSGKEMVDKLGNLIAIFENPALDFSKNRADGDDLLGDAYEYLMRHFATESGKSKGQFYTPSEVSRIMAKMIGIRQAKTSNKTTVYDPTCGSGSLLLKIGDEARHGKDVKVTLEGQEKDSTTAGLARMNMILHDYATAEIKQGNTLSNPLFKDDDSLKTYDYVVANPPFSDKRWSTGLHPNEGGKNSGNEQQSANDYGRFTGFGVPPPRQGDYAYLLHIIRSLKPDGKGACILPHGVLYRSNSEAAIRKNLILRGYIKAIIGLPANLFYGTNIAACIVVLDKENANARKGIFMIDASRGFIKDGNKNRLREQDIHKIVDKFTRQLEDQRYSRMVPVGEISGPKNDFNLNLSRYIDSTEPEDIQDIDAHLRGGIPNRDLDLLDAYWQVIPAVRAGLFKKADRASYSQLRNPAANIKSIILSHDEFISFNQSVTKLLDEWKTVNTPRLRGLTKDTRPKSLIETLSEDLLETFEKARLLDPYDIYQHLMDYWAETMQDDVYLITSDGWRYAAQPQLLIEDNTKKSKEKAALIVGRRKYRIELIPPALVIARYFAAEQAAIVQMETEIAAILQTIEEMAEEHGGEEGLLADAKNEKDKLTKASVKARLTAAEEGGADVAEPGEIPLLKEYLVLAEKETATTAALSDAQDNLAEKALAQYSKLTVDEIKTLVVDDKWMSMIAATVRSELERASQTLTERICQLAERYESPLPIIIQKHNELTARVEAHLKTIGFEIGLNNRAAESLLNGKKRLPGFHDEWKLKRLGEIFIFSGGYSASRDQLSKEGHCYLHYGDIHKSQKSYIDVSTEYQNIPKLNIPLNRISSSSLLDDGDVVFVDASEDDAGTSKHVVVVNKEKKPFISGLHTIVAKSKTDELTHEYRRYCFQTANIRQQFLYYAVGTKVTGISKTNIAKLTLPVPSILEQTAIAEVLSDMDTELAVLEQRRAKTHALRQGMMQELLTGKTRLMNNKST